MCPTNRTNRGNYNMSVRVRFVTEKIDFLPKNSAEELYNQILAILVKGHVAMVRLWWGGEGPVHDGRTTSVNRRNCCYKTD